ncbi:MAG: antirestriction protein ArdA, partial [Muribaculaceae bacterium]|nr:antirestriction protein ArdA [Muribaculaceae bacterium]
MARYRLHRRHSGNGKWSSEEDFAEQLAEDCCMLEGAPEFLKSYFDYKAFARDLFIDDYYFD